MLDAIPSSARSAAARPTGATAPPDRKPAASDPPDTFDPRTPPSRPGVTPPITPPTREGAARAEVDVSDQDVKDQRAEVRREGQEAVRQTQQALTARAQQIASHQ